MINCKHCCAWLSRGLCAAAVSLFILPESPRWLVVNGHLDVALAVIHRVYTKSILPAGSTPAPFACCTRQSMAFAAAALAYVHVLALLVTFCCTCTSLQQAMLACLAEYLSKVWRKLMQASVVHPPPQIPLFLFLFLGRPDPPSSPTDTHCPPFSLLILCTPADPLTQPLLPAGLALSVPALWPPPPPLNPLPFCTLALPLLVLLPEHVDMACCRRSQQHSRGGARAHGPMERCGEGQGGAGGSQGCCCSQQDPHGPHPGSGPGPPQKGTSPLPQACRRGQEQRVVAQVVPLKGQCQGFARSLYRDACKYRCHVIQEAFCWPC